MPRQATPLLLHERVRHHNHARCAELSTAVKARVHWSTVQRDCLSNCPLRSCRHVIALREVRHYAPMTAAQLLVTRSLDRQTSIAVPALAWTAQMSTTPAAPSAASRPAFKAVCLSGHLARASCRRRTSDRSSGGRHMRCMATLVKPATSCAPTSATTLAWAGARELEATPATVVTCKRPAGLDAASQGSANMPAGKVWCRHIHAVSGARMCMSVRRLSAHDRTQIEADVLRLLRNCEVALKQLQHSLEGVRPSRAGPTAGALAHLHGTVCLQSEALVIAGF
jgi:hypothetical protein